MQCVALCCNVLQGMVRVAVSWHDKHESAALIAYVSRRTLMPMLHHKSPAPVSKEASQYAYLYMMPHSYVRYNASTQAIRGFHTCGMRRQGAPLTCRNKRVLQTSEMRSLYIHMFTCCLIHTWARRMRHQGGPLTSHVRGVPWSPHDTALICVK